jgi:hypothetical protein
MAAPSDLAFATIFSVSSEPATEFMALSFHFEKKYQRNLWSPRLAESIDIHSKKTY